MIPISIPQKQIVLDFFANDIKIVKKYFNAIGFDFDETFKFDVFKEFIYSAAGMFKDLDPTIYKEDLVKQFNTIRFLHEHFTDFEQRSQYALKVYTKDFLTAQENYMIEKKNFDTLKSELQMLITKEQALTVKREQMEPLIGTHSHDDEKTFVEELKLVRREQVDTIHYIGTHRQELESIYTTLKAFEDLHKEEFIRYFAEIKEKLTHQYKESLNFFGYEFNESLFRDSERSIAIQKFKINAGIQGPINLCKYVEYYLRNVVPEALANAEHKERLLHAKRYCERITKI